MAADLDVDIYIWMRSRVGTTGRLDALQKMAIRRGVDENVSYLWKTVFCTASGEQE